MDSESEESDVGELITSVQYTVSLLLEKVFD